MSFLCLKPLMCWLLFLPGPRPPCTQALPLAPTRCRRPWPGPAPRLPDARLPWALAVTVSSGGWLRLFSAWPAPSPTVTSAFKPLTTCWRVTPPQGPHFWLSNAAAMSGSFCELPFGGWEEGPGSGRLGQAVAWMDRRLLHSNTSPWSPLPGAASDQPAYLAAAGRADGSDRQGRGGLVTSAPGVRPAPPESAPHIPLTAAPSGFLRLCEVGGE